MKVTIDEGKTLLVDGPASVTLLIGQVEVFGHQMTQSEKVIIRDGKRMPFIAEQPSSLEISLGENACIEEYEGSTIPPSWNRAIEVLMHDKEKNRIIVILGATDSGKTSFCTYLANRLLRDHQKIVVMDGDLGQSDIGPPCSIAYALLSKPVTDLFNLSADDAFFVGATSPSIDVEKVVKGMAFLRDAALKHNPDFIIVNTDGWVEGEDAIKYKMKLVREMRPHTVFCIQRKDELASLVNAISDCKIVMVESPQTIKQRSREKRKNLRELGYSKYLQNPRVQAVPISWLKIEGWEGTCLFHSDSSDPKRLEEVSSILGVKPLHVAEHMEEICIVIRGEKQVDDEKVKDLEKATGKKVNILTKGQEEGLLIALYDNAEKFLGIGLIGEIDYKRKIIKILTPVSKRFTKVVVGRVKLDKNFKEISANVWVQA